MKKLLPHVPLVFFGGCDGAERCMACYVPEYLPEDYLTSEDGRRLPCGPCTMRRTH